MYGLLNAENHAITPIEYDEINLSYSWWYRSDEIFEVKKSGQIGSIDLNGNIILPIEFSAISFDGPTNSRVCKDSVYYFAHGSDVNYDMPYEGISRVGNAFIIKKNGKYGVANYNGNVIIDPVYDKLEFSYSGIIAEKNGKKVTFDKYGKLITDFH